ncbi:MAG TPA: hypothetical protein VHL14_14100 [Steroidobacteraceae bacterium]|nr:hypothetical protein [Steroidobacteraceae bacterium]
MDAESTDIADGNYGTLKKFLGRHPVLTFVLMGTSFLVMGIISLNLVYLFHSNFEFILEYGVMALRDGGLIQFVELVLSGFVALAFYVLFKVCEKTLVEWLTERRVGRVKPPVIADITPSP